MDAKLAISIIILLVSCVIGIGGYWIKTAYAEIKQLLKELNTYIHELTKAVVTLQTQVDKQIESDISMLKENMESTNNKVHKHENQISILIREAKERNV